MEGVVYYRDPALPFLEAKLCRVKHICYKKHFHEEYSIGIIEEGVSRVWCDGEELQAGAGQLIGIPPLLPHACNPDEKSDWSYKMLFIHPGWISQTLGRDISWSGSPFFQEAANRACSRLMNRMIGQLKDGAPPLETEESAVAFITMALGVQEASCREANRTSREEERMGLVQDYLHEHFLEKVTLEELERVSGVSRYRIIRLFKEQTGLPPHAYQSLLRVNYAKKRLKPGKPLADAAMEAGFYDQSHFTRVFKHCTGVTPQRYIRSL